MHEEGEARVLCPHCNGRAVGKVGSDRYYCWDCCIEFTVDKEGVHLYRLDEEGMPMELLGQLGQEGG